MKSVLVIAALAVSVLADSIQFTNTSFVGPFNVASTYPLSWTEGNDLPVTLSLFNSTSRCSIFTGRAVLPTTYAWTVTPCAGFVVGTYQLALEQITGGTAISPAFNVTAYTTGAVVPTTTPAPISTVTVTYVYWDDDCGCTKTGTATTPLNTGLPVTTTKWWDTVCSCHKSAVVPVSTIPASNYTVPAAPPVTTPAPTSAPVPQPTTAPPATFTGDAVRLGSSIFGVMALVVAMIVA